MGWTISPDIKDILKKGADFAPISREEALTLMRLDLHSTACCALMHTADQMTRSRCSGKGELHFHIGLNVEPCPMDCRFCSLTPSAGIFTDKIEFPLETVLEWARLGAEKGADAFNIMTTGAYPFKKLLEIGNIIRNTVDVPIVANTRDISHKEGEQLIDAGFSGFYHAVRLGEGRDTPISREKRIRTIQTIKDVGLRWMNCVEPLGPEHSHEEIADLMFLAREYGAVYSGVMRRINFPSSPMEQYGMVTERALAKMVAVSRLVMGDVCLAHCTHEPNAASLMAGANLFFPEVGSSPRDGSSDTGRGRGWTLDACRTMMREMELNPDLPSNCF